MALDKFNWQNGSQVEPAKVEIEGVSYDVVDAQFEGETPLSASNLNLMQDTLLSNVKDNLEDESKIASCKAVKDIYSTDEVKTNKVWIDGKSIYRKTFTTTNLPSNATTTLGSISNLDTIIDINGIIPLEPDTSTKQYITLNHIRSSSLNWAIAPMVTNNDVQIMRGSFGTVSGTVYVTVEYTKTTD